MTFQSRCWLGCAIVSLHNLEEALTAPAWLAPRVDDLRTRFGVAPLAANAAQLYVGLAIITTIVVILGSVAVRSKPGSVGVYSLVAVFGVFFANAFVPHLVGTILLREYTPGVLSAAVLVVPFYVWFARQGLRERWLTFWPLVSAFAVGVAIYLPALWTIMDISSTLLRAN